MEYPFPAGNEQWSPRDIVAAFCRPGMADPLDYQVAEIVAVMLAESGGNPLAVGTPIWNPGADTHRSVDLGLCQLNSYYHTTVGVEAFPGMPALTIAQAFDPLDNVQRAWEVIARTSDGFEPNLSWWTAWKNGRHIPHFDNAYAGLVAYREWLAT